MLISDIGEIQKLGSFDCEVSLPDQNLYDKAPVLIHLHSAGFIPKSRILDFEPNNSINRVYNKLGWCVIQPINTKNDIWNPDDIHILIRKFIKSRDDLDKEKIVMTGHSMGARGVWDYICTYPGFCKAAVPISGFAAYLRAARVLDIPILAIRSRDDDIVPFCEAYKMVKKIESMGGKARMVELNGYGHSTNWTICDNDVVMWITKKVAK